MYLLSFLITLAFFTPLFLTRSLSSLPFPLIARAPSGKDNCKGSYFCSPGAVTTNCEAAVARFQDDKNYPGYSSCVSTDADDTFLAGCTAMYVCEGLYYANLKGKRLKEL